MKPDIVFFGEALPDRFGLHDVDTAIADFLIVMGTSLEVTNLHTLILKPNSPVLYKFYLCQV